MPASQLVRPEGAIADVADEVLRLFRRLYSLVQSAFVVVEHVSEGEGGAKGAKEPRGAKAGG